MGVISRLHQLRFHGELVVTRGAAQAVLNYAYNNNVAIEVIEVTWPEGRNGGVEVVTWGVRP